MASPGTLRNVGEVVAVRGSVVDPGFDGSLPAIHWLRYATDRAVGIEVLARIEVHCVRGIALTPTHGLARGMPVEDTGRPLLVPGRQKHSYTHARCIRQDHRAAARSLPTRIAVRPSRPSLARRSMKSDIFRTGVRIIDVRMPLERCGKTVLLTEMIPNRVGDHDGASIFCGIDERCLEARNGARR